uniref:Zebrafish testis-expressed 38 n=1 Tax=Myripristis murdjan TaxID=586833 RepID=A0A667YF12_9TELE
MIFPGQEQDLFIFIFPPSLSKWTSLFLNDLKTEQESLVFVKRMMALAVSSITYLRGIFPEDAYRSLYLEDLCAKVLREDCSTLGACKTVKWNENAEMRVTIEDTKKASVLLIRKLFLLMQNLDALPSQVHLTMRLYYYDDITPADYQPPGFKEGECSSLWFEGMAVHFRVGEVQTAFHTLKVRVAAEQRRLDKLQEGEHVKENKQESEKSGLPAVRGVKLGSNIFMTYFRLESKNNHNNNCTLSSSLNSKKSDNSLLFTE